MRKKLSAVWFNKTLKKCRVFPFFIWRWERERNKGHFFILHNNCTIRKKKCAAVRCQKDTVALRQAYWDLQSSSGCYFVHKWRFRFEINPYAREIWNFNNYCLHLSTIDLVSSQIKNSIQKQNPLNKYETIVAKRLTVSWLILETLVNSFLFSCDGICRESHFFYCIA